MKDQEKDPILHLPVTGYMEKQPDGSYKLNEEKSEWADIPASTVAAFLIEKFGWDAILKGGDAC